MGCLVGILIFTFFALILWGFSVSPILGIIIIIGILGFSIYFGRLDSIQKDASRKEQINNLSEKQAQLIDFTISQKFQSFDLKSSILLDEKRKKVCFIFRDKKTPEVYEYKDILETEIIEDGKTVTSTSRSSQLGGAIIGGVFAGGAGLVVGGLSGKKTSEQEVNQIDLKVVVNNLQRPNKIINFLIADIDPFTNKPLSIKRDSPKYKNTINTVNHWHSLLSLLIKQDIPLEEKQESKVEPTTKLSIAEEIKKLAELRTEGILTDEEFNQQKQKLLSS